MVLLAACGGGGLGGGDDDQPDEVCVPTGTEVHGDRVDNDCDGVIDELYVCADGSQPFTTIAAAIEAAPDGGGIEVCAGTYPEALAVSGRSIRINGAGAGATIIDAGGRVGLSVSGGDVTIAGLTIRGGGNPSEGGGIRCVDAALTVLDSALRANRAERGGGGLFAARCEVEIERTHFEANEGVLQGGGALLVESTGSITGSKFVGNSADDGGAVALLEGRVDLRTSELTSNHARVHGGALYQRSDSALDDTLVNDNTSAWTGGGIYVWKHAPTMSRNNISHNDAEWEGGGLYLHQTTGVLTENQIVANTSFDDGGGLRIFECAARLERNVIADNHAVDGDGGGFKSSHVAGEYIDNIITGNIALGAGGGIELDNDASVVRGGEISRNRASIGGGIHAMLWPWNGGLIDGVQLAGNHAWRGGGMYLENNYQPVTVRRVVLTGNTAHQGAGVYTRGTPLRMSNSLLIGNHAADVGGGFYVDPSASYPWTLACPCPPIDPVAEVDFMVVHGNVADAGAAVWIGAPNLSFQSSIFTGHTGTAVVAAPAATPIWRFNDAFPATFAGMADPTGGNGNLATDPAYLDPGVSNFRLQATSVGVNAGHPQLTDRDGSRADMGLYGGPEAPN